MLDISITCITFTLNVFTLLFTAVCSSQLPATLLSVRRLTLRYNNSAMLPHSCTLNASQQTPHYSYLALQSLFRMYVCLTYSSRLIKPDDLPAVVSASNFSCCSGLDSQGFPLSIHITQLIQSSSCETHHINVLIVLSSFLHTHSGVSIFSHLSHLLWCTRIILMTTLPHQSTSTMPHKTISVDCSIIVFEVK